MRRFLFVASLCWAVAIPSARAQCTPEPEPLANLRPVARGHYNDGVEAASAERWEAARAAFQRAEDIAAFAQIIFNLATAQAHTQLVVESAENYRRFLRRCASEETPDLRSDAQTLLAEVSLRTARVTLRIRGVEDTDILTIAGAEFDQAVLGVEIPLNPGPHEIRLTRGEVTILDHEVDLAEGATTTLDLSVNDADGSVIESGQTGAGGGSPSAAGIALVVVGGAFIGGGVGTLFWWLDRSDATDQCTMIGCMNPAQLAEERDIAGGTTIALFGTGVLFVVVGAVLLAVDSGGDGESASVRCAPTLGGVACDGVF